MELTVKHVTMQFRKMKSLNQISCCFCFLDITGIPALHNIILAFGNETIETEDILWKNKKIRYNIGVRQGIKS